MPGGVSLKITQLNVSLTLLHAQSVISALFLSPQGGSLLDVLLLLPCLASRTLSTEHLCALHRHLADCPAQVGRLMHPQSRVQH